MCENYCLEMILTFFKLSKTNFFPFSPFIWELGISSVLNVAIDLETDDCTSEQSNPKLESKLDIGVVHEITKELIGAAKYPWQRGCHWLRGCGIHKCLSAVLDKLFKFPKLGFSYRLHGTYKSSNLISFCMY